ncbi:MAG: biopolymer transporter ExbD [Silvanigrellales bacterium]|jgi:biopolymer transport protein ExbD|nr:biopolymer transporter ExbD [Silvanigrellales bacterium]
MAGGALKDDGDVISEINVTPFVDVVLVLLVIFMVTAGFITNKGVSIELPQAATAEQLQMQRTFNILVSKEGNILLDGQPVTTEGLRARGSEAKGKGEKVVAMISADKGVIYSSVVGVMDALRSVGIADFALQLEPLPAGVQATSPVP